MVTKRKLYKSKFNQIGTEEYPIRVVLGDPYKLLNFSQGFFTDLKVFKEILKKSQGFAPTKLGRSAKKLVC